MRYRQYIKSPLVVVKCKFIQWRKNVKNVSRTMRKKEGRLEEALIQYCEKLISSTPTEYTHHAPGGA